MRQAQQQTRHGAQGTQPRQSTPNLATTGVRRIKPANHRR
jgi:hypothetical protein